LRTGLSALAATLAAAALLSACGGGETIARVGDRDVSEEDVERLVEFYEEETVREGREPPVEGTEAHRRLEIVLLGQIVYRQQLEQAAAEEFGIELDEEEVEARLEESAEGEGEEGEGGEEEGAARAFIENAVRIQLVKEKVAARIGNDGLQAWLEKATRTVPVEYEEGWAPAGGGKDPAPVTVP
jgi:hypothetical protein